MTELDVSGFDTSNVTNMTYMFNGCSGLTAIYASGKFVTDKVEDSVNMFYGCASLVGDADTKYDENHMDKEYAWIDAPGTPGYFTLKTA